MNVNDIFEKAGNNILILPYITQLPAWRATLGVVLYTGVNRFQFSAFSFHLIIYPLLALMCTATAITSVSTPPRMYASVRFSMPHITGEMKIYDEQT